MDEDFPKIFVMTNNRPRAVDLFAGCGGLTLGLKKAGFRVVGAIESDPRTAESYRLNHPTVDLQEKHIEEINVRVWMKRLGVGVGELDLLAGCPPCQGFSALRTRNGAKRNRDKRNALILEMARFARISRPKAIMMENVPALRSKKVFRTFVKLLESPAMGYTVNFCVQDAQHFGVPQRRRRLVMIAGRGFGIDFPKPSKLCKSVRQTIESLPLAGQSGDRIHDLPERRSSELKRWIAKLPKDGGSRKDVKQKQRMCHQRCDGFNDTYGRMSWDGVAPTITGGCFNPSKGRFLHPEKNRNITLREAAMLQGLPRKYRFSNISGKQAIALMIGNALPPEFVRCHARPILAKLKINGRRQ